MITNIHSLNEKIIGYLNRMQFVILTICRYWLAKIFFLSGLTKLSNWDQTLFLFEYEYAVPFLPVNLAALLATTAEITMPILLILGLFTRYAAFTLLIMTSIIQFVIIQHDQHLYWMLIMAVIIVFGAGKFSLDRLISKQHNISV